MKHVKIILALMICLLLGCSTPELDDKSLIVPSGKGSGGGSYASIANQTLTLSAMQTNIATVLSAMHASPSSNLVTQNGFTYIQFRNNTNSTGFNYLNDLRVVYSTDFPTMTWDDATTEITSLLSNLKAHTTWKFRNEVMSLFNWTKDNFSGMTFAQFESGMESRLSSIANPPNIAGLPKLTAMEQFALTQGHYAVLNQVRWIYQNPSQSSSSCLPQTKEEWKGIASAAIRSGLTFGLKMGWDGIVAGVLAAGGHPVGGIIGGLTGFTIGFVGGAVMAGGVLLTANCITNKLFSLKRAFQCAGGIYYAYSTASPMGCSPISGGVELKSIVNFGLVPNKGKTALATSVIQDLNWLLTYL